MSDTSSVHVLVIEDDDVARGSIVRALQDVGYQVASAANGQQGLDVALREHPRVIVCDNLMPVMTGTDVLAKLRSDPWGSEVPFILLTSQFSVEAINDSLEAGNTDFLVKDDISLDKVVESVRRRLG